tara:strand:- start:18914 stop:19240 length:327 start_codon:yes stop_codon:yes gene_type:complete
MKLMNIDEFGTKKWYLNGELHREDGPAIEWFDGEKEWYLNGKLHRVDGHAIEWSNGTKEWFLNDLRHREDGPAFESFNGNKYWYYHGNHIDCKDLQEFLRMIKLMAFL